MAMCSSAMRGPGARWARARARGLETDAFGGICGGRENGFGERGGVGWNGEDSCGETCRRGLGRDDRQAVLGARQQRAAAGGGTVDVRQQRHVGGQQVRRQLGAGSHQSATTC